MHGSWDMERDRIFSHFGRFFGLLPPNSPKNHNFKKVKIFFIILHMCTKNYDQMIYSSWDPVRDGWLERQMDGWKDRQKDQWMTERQTDEQTYWRMDRQTDGWTDGKRTDGRKDRSTNTQTDRKSDI